MDTFSRGMGFFRGCVGGCRAYRLLAMAMARGLTGAPCACDHAVAPDALLAKAREMVKAGAQRAFTPAVLTSLFKGACARAHARVCVRATACVCMRAWVDVCS